VATALILYASAVVLCAFGNAEPRFGLNGSDSNDRIRVRVLRTVAAGPGSAWTAPCRNLVLLWPYHW